MSPATTEQTLALNGIDLHVNPPAEGALISELMPDARLEIFEHSGHLLSWEEPERYIASIRAFLAAPG